MRIVGHGIDLVETERIARLVAEHGDRFLERCFSPQEREYAGRSPRRRDERLAVRFAAKEAVLKALGTGWSEGIGWRDVEVVRAPSGEPSVRLAGRCAEIARGRGIVEWRASLSHTERCAVASVIAIAER